MTAWLGWLEARPREPGVVIAETEAGVLAGWRSSRERPHPAARRLDPRLLHDPAGAAWVSLVWPRPAAMMLFDDPAVLFARQAALAGALPRTFSTLVADSTSFAGSVWVADEEESLDDDPFRRLGPCWSVYAPAGWFGRTPRPCGPAVERYAGAPWPDDGASTSGCRTGRRS